MSWEAFTSNRNFSPCTAVRLSCSVGNYWVVLLPQQGYGFAHSFPAETFTLLITKMARFASKQLGSWTLSPGTLTRICRQWLLVATVIIFMSPVGIATFSTSR